MKKTSLFLVLMALVALPLPVSAMMEGREEKKPGRNPGSAEALAERSQAVREQAGIDAANSRGGGGQVVIRGNERSEDKGASMGAPADPSLSTDLRSAPSEEKVSDTIAPHAIPLAEDNSSLAEGRVIPLVEHATPARDFHIIAIPANLSIDDCVAAGVNRETLLALAPLSQRELDDLYADFIETRDREQAESAESSRVKEAYRQSNKERAHLAAQEEAAMWEAVRAARVRDRDIASAQEAEAAAYSDLIEAISQLEQARTKYNVGGLLNVWNWRADFRAFKQAEANLGGAIVREVASNRSYRAARATEFDKGSNAQRILDWLGAEKIFLDSANELLIEKNEELQESLRRLFWPKKSAGEWDAIATKTESLVQLATYWIDAIRAAGVDGEELERAQRAQVYWQARARDEREEAIRTALEEQQEREGGRSRSPDPEKTLTKKEAANAAARIAYDHYFDTTPDADPSNPADRDRARVEGKAAHDQVMNEK